MTFKELTIRKRADIRADGWHARMRGIALAANPHQPGLGWSWWHTGWIGADMALKGAGGEPGRNPSASPAGGSPGRCADQGGRLLLNDMGLWTGKGYWE